jgi:cephalosporin-C deacetylase-like acetyl esterase
MKANLKTVAVPEEYKDKVKCYDVKVDCWDGVPVSGYLALPVNAETKLPAIVLYHGAGVRSSSMPLDYAAMGAIALDVNAHGIENGRDEAFYENLNNGRLKNYRFDGSDDRDKIYFKGVFLRVLRSLEFIKSQKQWDRKTLIVFGGSQGGGQALFAAGMDSDISLCVAHFPSMCNHRGILLNQSSGGPPLIKMKDGKPENENVIETAPYFDNAYFASRIKAETFISVGFIDVVCSPGSIYAAYNNIKAPKFIINNIFHGHVVSDKAKEHADGIIKKALNNCR